MQGNETIEAIGLSELAALAYQVLVVHLGLASPDTLPPRTPSTTENSPVL
jgi:hypothetical protein